MASITLFRRLLLSAFFLVGIGSVYARSVPTPALAQSSPPTLVSMTVEGAHRQVPDVARLTVGVNNHAPDAKTALAENSARMDRVVSAIRAAKVDERDIQTRRISIHPQHRHPPGGEPVLTGYRANNSVSLRVRDLARLGDVLDAVVASGANEIDGPYFEVASPELAYEQARLGALEAARERAQRYADALGLRVVRVVSVDEGGGFRATPLASRALFVQSAQAQDMSAPPVAPGESVQRARLVVVFELGVIE